MLFDELICNCNDTGNLSVQYLNSFHLLHLEILHGDFFFFNFEQSFDVFEASRALLVNHAWIQVQAILGDCL